MSRRRISKLVLGLCVVSIAGPACAAGSPFIGSWHLNRAESTTPPGELPPGDVTAEIVRADSAHLKWSLTTVVQGQPNVETFDTPANGEFYPISSDTTASFRLTQRSLEAVFKGSAGQTDALTCTLGSDQKKMTCRGVLTDEHGHATSYVDVYDRM